MDRESTLLMLANRAFLYGLLARGFAEEPDEAFLDILRGEHTQQEAGLLAHELTDAIVEALDQLVETASEQPLHALRQEYTTVFVGPGTLKAYPWETVHLSDVKSLFQPELLPIREAYRAAGFLPARYPHVQDDFIGLEFDFLAKLASAALQDWQNGDDAQAMERLEHSRSFLDEHLLRWIDAFAQAVEDNYGNGFYARFAKLAALVVRRDRDMLD